MMMGRCDLVRVAGAALLTVLTVPMDAWAQHGGEEIVPVEPFEAVHVDRTRVLDLAGGPDEVFEMFSPEGRARWSSFRPVLLHRPDEGWKGAVYLQATVHDEPNTAVVADYDPLARRIRYLTVIPRAEAWELEVRVEPTAQGSKAYVTYRVTSLSSGFNETVSNFFATDFARLVDQWAPAIDKALGR